MHLKLSKSGKKFFFITLCTEGREKTLSRINDDATIALMPAGEAIVNEWRAQHAKNAALTASNFVIMPDHVHLLLIVDYDKSPDFDIIDWIHNFTATTASGSSAAGATGGSGALPRPLALRWEPHFWLVLSFDSRQLSAIRRYIKLNPARALWKIRNPDRFIRRANIRHAVLDETRRWDALGDLTLIASPFIFPVRLTRKKTVEEHKAEIDKIIAKARHGAIPVSGFISPGEKEVLRRLKAEPLARFIKTLPHALPPRYDPSAEDSRELAAGRMLILSGFPQTVQHNGTIARSNCLLMNDLITAMCTRAATLK